MPRCHAIWSAAWVHPLCALVAPLVDATCQGQGIWRAHALRPQASANSATEATRAPCSDDRCGAPWPHFRMSWTSGVPLPFSPAQRATGLPSPGCSRAGRQHAHRCFWARWQGGTRARAPSDMFVLISRPTRSLRAGTPRNPCARRRSPGCCREQLPIHALRSAHLEAKSNGRYTHTRIGERCAKADIASKSGADWPHDARA